MIRYDVCYALPHNPLTEYVIEIDAHGHEGVRAAVQSIIGDDAEIRSIRAHKERISKPVTIWVCIEKMMRRFNG